MFHLWNSIGGFAEKLEHKCSPNYSCKRIISLTITSHFIRNLRHQKIILDNTQVPFIWSKSVLSRRATLTHNRVNLSARLIYMTKFFPFGLNSARVCSALDLVVYNSACTCSACPTLTLLIRLGDPYCYIWRKVGLARKVTLQYHH